jgi:hypothetical protein
MSNKKLLIITGPQGSGNHIFSRLFSLHEEVAGWDGLLDTYWVPSDQEPFAEYWVKPELLTPAVFENHQYHMANVSCPFFYDGVRYVPKILEVAERVKSFGIDVVIGIVVRSKYQQATAITCKKRTHTANSTRLLLQHIIAK